MKTFLERFYDYVKSPEGFNCVQFEYDGIVYQLVEGANINFIDKSGKKHHIELPNDIEHILDAKILNNGKSLREVWNNAGENELFPEFY